MLGDNAATSNSSAAHISCLAACSPKGAFLALCLRRDLAVSPPPSSFSPSRYSLRVISCPQKLSAYLSSLSPLESQPPVQQRQVWANRPDDYEINLGEAARQARSRAVNHVGRTFTPSITLVSQYMENFVNGNHFLLLKRYGEAMAEGKAMAVVSKVVSTWTRRVDECRQR